MEIEKMKRKSQKLSNKFFPLHTFRNRRKQNFQFFVRKQEGGC